MTRKRFELISTSFCKRGRPITTQLNSYHRSHTLQAYFSKRAGLHESRIYLHSELATLIKSKNNEVYSLLVQRFDAKGNPKDARPCLSCIEAMKAWGVVKVRYTTEAGIKEELVKDM